MTECDTRRRRPRSIQIGVFLSLSNAGSEAVILDEARGPPPSQWKRPRSAEHDLIHLELPQGYGTCRREAYFIFLCQMSKASTHAAAFSVMAHLGIVRTG